MDKEKKESIYPREYNEKPHCFGESLYFSGNEVFIEMILRGREWKVGLYLKDKKGIN